MEDKLNQYFITLRKFSNLLLNKLIDNGSKLNYELRLSQMKALSAFRSDRPFLMKELADSCGAKLPNMTTMVDNLIEEGFAERERDELDRRKVWVNLTSKGKKVRAHFLKNRRKLAQSIFSKLSEEDKNELLSSLENVCKIFEKTISKNEQL